MGIQITLSVSELPFFVNLTQKHQSHTSSKFNTQTVY